VYYVQYAHARICSILRKAEEAGVSADADGATNYVYQHPSELTLIRKLLELEEVIEQVALQLQPHHFTTYAQSLATTFSAFYRDCRVLGESPNVSAARIRLAQAARITLARVLRLMGISAPERM
jgi:arginyl-tRNA synthetase